MFLHSFLSQKKMICFSQRVSFQTVQTLCFSKAHKLRQANREQDYQNHATKMSFVQSKHIHIIIYIFYQHLQASWKVDPLLLLAMFFNAVLRVRAPADPRVVPSENKQIESCYQSSLVHVNSVHYYLGLHYSARFHSVPKKMSGGQLCLPTLDLKIATYASIKIKYHFI